MTFSNVKVGGVVMETTMGSICFELYWDEAPMACEHFCKLADSGHYDNALFGRVVKDFIIQGGNLNAGGYAADDLALNFDGEITPKLKFTGAGILAFAEKVEGTAGNQFFVTLAPCPWIDGKYAIFGRVLTGMKVVKRIGLVPTNDNDRPVQAIIIRKAYSFEGEAPTNK